LQEAIAGTRGR